MPGKYIAIYFPIFTSKKIVILYPQGTGNVKSSFKFSKFWMLFFLVPGSIYSFFFLVITMAKGFDGSEEFGMNQRSRSLSHHYLINDMVIRGTGK